MACGSRFTTFERIQLRELTVIKKDGKRMLFDRDKLVRSVAIALRKRSVEPELIDRLINVSLPRVRDFRGISSKSFDKKGNYALGIKEQIVFPEINYDIIDKVRGMEITVVTSAKDDERGRRLLSLLGMPFQGRMN